MSRRPPPVIAIDGPSGSGKGTVARLVARKLGYHYLDSGALYRLVGLAVKEAGIDLESESRISDIALNLNVKWDDEAILMNGRDVADAIRAEEISEVASRVAALAGVRRALLQRQRGFRQAPGLVADGRDMGSVVFPDAALKIYLTASAEERARRRYKQLMVKGISANMDTLLQDISGRDLRDSTRVTAPLQKCTDATQIDNTAMTVDEVVEQVLAQYSKQ